MNTNVAAITALRTLQQTNNQLDATQGRISTGLKIGEAKDNAAYWAISTTLKSDNKSLGTVKDALGLGSATVDVAYQGLNKAKDVLDEIKAKLTAATQPGVDKNVIQSEIGELQKQLLSIAGSSVFSGENWLSVNSEAVDYDATKKIVASFARDANNSVAIGTVDVAIGGVALFDSSTVVGKNGILDNLQNLKESVTGKDLTIGGTPSASGNNLDAGLTAAGTTGKLDGNTIETTAGSVGAANAAVAAANTGGNRAQFETATFATSGATQVQTGNDFTFTLTVDGVGVALDTNAVVPAGLASASLADMGALLQTTIDASALAGKVKVDVSSGTTIKFLSTTGNTGATSSIALSAWTNSTAVARTGDIVNGSALTGTIATEGRVVTGAVSRTGLVAGDTVTFSYKTAGTIRTPVTLTLSGADLVSDAKLAEKLATATLTSGTVTQVGGTGGTKLSFASSATGGSFELSDVVVNDAAGRIKNSDIVSGFTESHAGTALTGDVQTAWTTNFTATDTITMGLTVDGTVIKTGALAAGGSLSAFVGVLNGDVAFTAKAFASVDSSNNLLITSKTSGATSAVTVDSVLFKDSTGAVLNKTGTNFRNVATVGTATTGAVFPVAGITLDANDNLYFNIAVDGATTSKLVTIDQALVNKVLSTPTVPVTDGKITNATQFASVMSEALTAAKVTGVTAKVGTGVDLNKLVLTSTKIGAGSSVAITSVQASQGANQISVDKIDISDAGLTAARATSGADISKVLSAYITVVNNAINSVTTAASNLGAVASRIDMQKSFVNTLMDTIDKGVGNLIDADMSEESTRLQALQTKQQLGVQALSIANQSSQNILSLFR
ncbi:flagellin N-terminal helical domain-containing protein [Aureimonas pseudogalii]|uniref:Flagellin n=1 Tax=Aureimonas pseudogalii TaxID=1744844 RepID=A0A7W6E7Y5_9HYPH|nr:flagellin-like hook-associated protein FlgL [Aureimonas pseudogalii]